LIKTVDQTGQKGAGPMRLKLILIAGAIAAAIFVAGCGGGGGSTSEDTTAGGGNATTAKSEAGESKPMTKTEFHTRVNEICIEVPRNYEEDLKKLEKGGKKPSKAESNLKAAVPPLEAAIGEMKETVTPPPAEEQVLEEVVAALESAAKGLEEKPTSELSGPQSPFAEFQEVTKKSGFETCSGL
jgi:hypothetical protein